MVSLIKRYLNNSLTIDLVSNLIPSCEHITFCCDFFLLFISHVYVLQGFIVHFFPFQTHGKGGKFIVVQVVMVVVVVVDMLVIV